MFLSIHTVDVWLVPLIKIYMKYPFGLDPEQFFLLSYTKQYFFTLYIMVKNYYNNINTDDRKIYIDDDGSGIFPKQKYRKLYNKNIKRHMEIDVMFFPSHIYNIQ